MRRSSVLIALLVLVLIGVPVVFALAGGDDEPSEQAAVPSDAGGGTPPASRGGGERAGGGARGGDGGRDRRGAANGNGGPPPGAGAYDEQMRGVGYPELITESGAAAATDATRVLGREVAPDQRTVFAADCRSGTCTIRYRSAPRGRGRILAGQAALVRRLFAREGVEKVVLYAHHAIVGRDKEERPAFALITCPRGGHDWSELKVKTLTRRCSVTHQAGGKLRNQIRRGQLSVEDAGRGREAARPSGGGATAPGESRPAPRNVDGSAAAERKARERE